MADTSGRPNPWSTLAKLIAALLAASILVAGLALPYVGGLGLAARRESDKFLNTACNLQETQPPQKTTLYARDGKTVIATLFSQDRVLVPLSSIPTYLQQALVATEDRRFYIHHGVDMRGLLRSAVSTSSGSTQGGSTLTMQYVKQMRYYQAGQNLALQQAAINQNLNRKIEDAKCALYIEGTLHESKASILDNYLNIAFFGENAYGIQTAAETYFNKNAKDLTLPESALLVGLLRAPTEYDPFLHLQAATKRRNEVLQNLVSMHDLTSAEAVKYGAAPVRLATTAPPVVRQGCNNATTSIKNAGFFCDYVVNWLENVNGLTPTQLQTGGLKIVTTLDANLQNSAQSRLAAQLPATAAMTALLPVVDPKSGDVLAMASNKLFGNPTSAKDNTHTSLPVFSEATAFGASTYKLFSLLTALETGVPSTWQLDTYGATGAATQSYVPSNCYGATPKLDTVTNGDSNVAYTRNETLASGTAKSSNTFYVGMDDQLFGCNLQPIVDLARSLGMTNFDAVDPNGNGKTTIGQSIVNNSSVLQLALGSGLATSPLELAGAYAAVANGGQFNAPAPVLRITGEKGDTLPVKRTPAVTVLAPQVAAQAVQILEGDTIDPYGTSYSKFQSWYAANPSLIAGKTGTAIDSKGNQNSALWFVGMTPNLVATSVVFNPAAPSDPISALPGISNAGTNAYGDYASQLWLQSLQPSLIGTQWTWPDPNAMPGLTAVPTVTGMDLATAKATLGAQGFAMQELGGTQPVQCASSVPAGMVAFYGPQLAAPQSTITVCQSSGIAQQIYAPPPPPPPAVTKSPSPTKSASRGPGGGNPRHPG